MPEPEKTNLSRREREREQHRQEILDAAEAMFSSKGIAEVTIEDVAKKADFAVGSIYNFFGGKEDLVHQVMLRLATWRVDEIESSVLLIQDKPVEALKMLTHLWFSHHTKHGAFLRVVFHSNLLSGKRPGEPCENPDMRLQMKRYETAICKFFESGVKAGVFQKLDPQHLMLMFEGICRSFLFASRWTHDTRPKQELEDELFAAVHAAITGHLFERPRL